MNKLIPFALGVCAAIQSASLFASQTKDLRDFPPIQCPDGKVEMFSLSATGFETSSDEVKKSLNVENLFDAGGNIGARIEVCIDSIGSVTLERVLYHTSSEDGLKVYERSAAGIIEATGVDAAIFGDSS